ncbi:MAG: hypothetical protein MJ063_01170 [Lachnospiraceae bacterium]|nr:hypothetical protein [Lachnospiraceae bacterium]
MSVFERIELWAIGKAIKVKNFLDDEKGDTNFISILIILAIGLSVAWVFITYKDKMLVWVENTIPENFK